MRNIVEQEGRDPTPEEMDQALRIQRESLGMDPELPSGTYLKWPSEVSGKTTPYGQKIIDSMPQGGVDRPDPFAEVREDMFAQNDVVPTVPTIKAFNDVFDAAQITGNETLVADQMENVKRGATVQDELLDSLMEAYQDDEFRVNQLAKIHELPPEEQRRMLEYEISRRDAHSITAREGMLIHVFRAGHGDMEVSQFEKVKREFNVNEIEQFRTQIRDQQITELRTEVDNIVAKQSFDGHGVMQIIQQDFVPVLNIVTRIANANIAANQIDTETGWFRSLFPGEVRNDIRKWFTTATPEERVQFVKDLGAAMEQISKGTLAPYFTEYGVIENYMGLFTDDLLEQNLPKDNLDRWLSNLDIVLESLFGVGVVASVGGRGLARAYRANNVVRARRVARATGNKKLRQKLDRELGIVLQEAGEDASEAALVHMPRPPSLVGRREALSDDLKDTVERAENIRSEILSNSDDLTGIGLSVDDKVNVVRKELSELDSHDTMVVLPSMSVLEELPNGVGFKYKAVYGQTPNGGWRDLKELLEELDELDPDMINFRVLRRNAQGELEEVTDLPSRVRGVDVEEGYGLNNLSDEELLRMSQQVDKDSDAFKALEDEAMRRAHGQPYVGDALRHYDGEEYFLELDHERYWHHADKETLGPGTWRNTASFIPRGLIPPNARFGHNFFMPFDRAYRIEQQTIRRLEQIYKPLYDLNSADRAWVTSAMEWIEDYAKREGKLPDIATMYSEFPQMSDAQLKGILAVNQGLNVQWELFNRRLYREWHTQGFQTGTPRDSNLPTFHGKTLEESAVRPGKVYDPVTQKQVELTAGEIADIYERGGSVMRLDMAIDIPGETGKASTLVLLDPSNYKTGKLSTSVLEYHPGYYSRFYEDPFYIVKRSGKEVDGRRTDLVEDALRTAGSVEEAERFLRRFATLDPRRGVWVNDTDPSKTYRIQRAQELDQTESSLFAKQALGREGRLFWDKRNFDRLPDVNGNRAPLEDPIKALNRSTVMATRQTTHEDLMKSIKRAFEVEFKDIIGPSFHSDTISETIRRLQKERKSIAEPALRTRYDQAIETAKYIRLQQGTDEVFVPLMREQAVRVAAWVSRMSGRIKSPLISEAGFKLSKVLDNYAASMDPLRSMRATAFHMFMVFRPVRQLLLQGAQISFLTALDPLYIGSGRVFKDGLTLRSGLMSLTKAGYDDSLSMAKRAKLMGLSQRQFKRLVAEFDRSGLVDTVDVHAFAGGAKRPKTAATKVGQGYKDVAGFFQRIGFDVGEQANLSFTYMVALRRYMAKMEVDDLMKLDRGDWDEIANQAQALALGMTKPNKMAYQSGALGNMMQFLSFSHKALITMLGQNPALTKMDAFKIAATSYVLFGANMFGAGDYARDKLNSMGLGRWADQMLPDYGKSLVDLLTVGLIQTSINTIGRATSEEWKDIDTSFAAPGVNVLMLYKELIMGIAEAPWGTAMGPFGNIATNAVDGLNFAQKMFAGHQDVSDIDKALRTADYMLRGVMPQYNDVRTAIIAAQTQRWVSRSGKVLPMEFEPTWATLLARGAMGVRTEEELAWYRYNNEQYQTKAEMRSIVEANRDWLITNLSLYYKGELDGPFLEQQLEMLASWVEDWPEHLRMEILKQSLISENPEGQSAIKLMVDNIKQHDLDVVGILEQFPDMPAESKRELQDFIEEVYNDRVQNTNQFFQEDLRDKM